MAYFNHLEAKKLAEELKKENLSSYAEGLISAIEDGATGTEIIMALRWNIEKLLVSKKGSNSIKEKATRLFKELDKALELTDK